MKKTALLMGDITGRSRVAVRMMTAVLEERGIEVLALPTALISNTLNLGVHAALDTTDYLLESLKAWEEIGLAWDAVHIGYIASSAQAAALCPISRASCFSSSLVSRGSLYARAKKSSALINTCFHPISMAPWVGSCTKPFITNSADSPKI